ncbi:hypothetical protein [Tautonia sociabilis]|uniref:hypothetical protein n=1 Tax=Tautonia sociabilis TaxID=2080755 RepID=UPI0018F6F0A3|nr:hypothetical protein [Tautonia sociabilis]
MNAATIRGALAAYPPRFDPGRIVITPGAIEALANNNELVSTYIVRHASGDWGDLDPSDRRENDAALETGLRILSAYGLPKGDTIWVITEAVDVEAGDSPIVRTLTTVLLPCEY